MKYTSVDWFYGICYNPTLMGYLRKANPSITDDRLRSVFSVLPVLSDEELSDTTAPSHRIVDISLENTSNYFDMGADYLDRPHDLSVACFNKEVLSKYEVRIEGSSVYCSDWGLRDVYVNSAGQIHACICDLRNLSEEEMNYWKAHNVSPAMEGDSERMPPPFHGMAKEFVSTCLFNSVST